MAFITTTAGCYYVSETVDELFSNISSGSAWIEAHEVAEGKSNGEKIFYYHKMKINVRFIVRITEYDV